MRAFQLAASIAWAIDQQWLTTILEIAAGEGPGPEAVAKELGRPLDNSRTVTVRDRVAIIPVTGPIFRYANAFSAISGATSVQILARDFAQAMASDDVDAILLDVNSPGGQVDGIDELAAQIAAARGQKPIAVYAGGSICSAAYWLGSAADEIVVGTTALVGSVGVLHAVPNKEATSAKDVEIVSSRAPRKVPDPMTKQGRADIQAMVDAIEDVMVATIAKNRGVTTKKVTSDFGQGGVLVGEAAVAAGMADRVGSFESTLTALRDRAAALHEGTRMKAFLVSMATLLGLAATASEEEVTAAVHDREATRKSLSDLTGKSTSGEALATVRAWKETAADHGRLSEELNAIRADKKKAEIEAIIADGRRAGRLTKDLEAVARKSFTEPDALKAFVEALPVAVNTTASETANELHAVSALTPEERKICALSGVTEEQFMKTKSALKGAQPKAEV